jgi:hypothetical protein
MMPVFAARPLSHTTLPTSIERARLRDQLE